MSRCRSCGAEIAWALTERGKPIPLDPEPRADGNLVVVQDGAGWVARKPDELLERDAPRYVSHFATCPSADQHRSKR